MESCKENWNMAQPLRQDGQKGYGSIGEQGSDGATSFPSIGFAGPRSSTMSELKHLTDNIITNIYTINASGKNLEQALKSIGTDRDNRGLRDKVHVTQLSCNQIVAQTTKDLQRLTLVVRKGNKEERLQVEKLTNDFKEAVKCYSQFQKKVADQMKVCLLAPTQEYSQSTIYNDDEEKLIQRQDQIQAQNSLLQELEFEQGMLAEREQRIQQIEGDILDINQIMRELGSMVHEQGEAVNSIESNIENIHGNVELGTQELERAAEYQKKFRKKLCILASIAIIVGIIFAVILVTQLKS